MNALYGSEPQFGASGSIFFACGNTTYYKLISRASKRDPPTWPVPVHAHTNDIIGIAVVTASNTELLEGRLSHLQSLISADLRTSLMDLKESSRINLVASVSRDEMILSLTIATGDEYDNGKLSLCSQIASIKLTIREERFMALVNSQETLVCMMTDKEGTSCLKRLDAFKIRSSENLTEYIKGDEKLLNLGRECIPIAIHMRRQVLGAILSVNRQRVASEVRDSNGNGDCSSPSPSSKIRKSRQQTILYLDFTQSDQVRGALMSSDNLSQTQRDLSAIAVEGVSLCLAEQGGALHWWSVPNLDSSYELESSSSLDELAPLTTDNRIRVHWHNATLSALKLHCGLTYSGGEQSRLICWNLESGSQKVQNLLIGDGCILNIQVPEDNSQNHVLVTTSTNKIYVLDMRVISDHKSLVKPQVIGPALPVIYPAKLVEVKMLSHLKNDSSLTKFLQANGGRTKIFKGFAAGNIQVSILAFHQSPARVCAHDGDFRLNRITDDSSCCSENVEGFPFSFMTLRSHKKHSWCRPESLKSGSANSLYTGAHVITDATALPNLDLVVVATTIGSGIDRVNLLELFKIQKKDHHRPLDYHLKLLSQTTLTKAPVALESVGDSGLVIAFEDGKLHFSRFILDDQPAAAAAESTSSVSSFFYDLFSFQRFRVTRRDDLGKPLTYRDWRSGVREQVLAKPIDF